MSAPAVRLLAREDADALARLHAICFDPAERWSAQALAETIAQPTTIGLSVEDEEEIAGFILVQRVAPDAEILTLAVRPSARRRGIAKTLLKRSLDLLGQRGVGRLMLDVAADNVGAVRFYERMGFLADGRRPNYYQREEGRQADAILMSRPVAGQLGESEA